MRHWSQLGIRNWRAKPGRTAGALAAIALGVGVVVWVTCAYESVRLAVVDQVWFWIGRSHLSVESAYGPEGTVYQSISDELRALPNVEHVTYRLKHRLIVHPIPDGESTSTSPERAALASAGMEIEAIGIDPASEYRFRKYDEDRVAGRILTPDDTDAAMMEYKLAEQLNLRLGDRFVLRSKRTDADDRSAPNVGVFKIVGLVQHRRVASQQLPIVVTRLDRVQELADYDAPIRRVTKIDMILKDSSSRALRAAERQVRKIVERQQQGFLVTSAENKIKRVEAAERQTRFVLLLLSCVALFTAFFVILSTLSMGMVERIAQLGMLRCLGVTRIQMALLALSEAVPLGVVGIVLGIPVGLVLTKLSVWLAEDYIGQFVVSGFGLLLALAGGAVTTLVGALLPMLQAMRISPLAASRPQAKPARGLFPWIAAIAGVAMIAGHSWMIPHLPANKWIQSPTYPVAAVALLYGGYALVTPALVRVIGQTAVHIVSLVLRIRHRLLSDQVGRAAWRSAGICCGLMVGLSLIVSLVVHSESLAAGWDFPKQFCEAVVYVSPPIARRRAEEARRIPGVAESCLANVSTFCAVYGRGLLHFPTSRFVAGDPEEFFRLARLEFVQGNEAEALEKLAKGRHVLVTPEFVRSQKLGYRDKVLIRMGFFNHPVQFEIAGVVTSPAVDIAANYFNAGGRLVAASVHVVLGTMDDARRVFKVPDEVSMFLLNFDLDATPPPPEFENDSPPALHDPKEAAVMISRWGPLLPERGAEIDRIDDQSKAWASGGVRTRWIDAPMLELFRRALLESVFANWSNLSPSQRWQTFREELVLRLVADHTGAPIEEHASARALKLRIDRDLRRATMLFATIPMVALIVAALGVANLMTANVASRSHQIAMLRAVGATKWQVVRLVVGEALVLGTLGSLIGVLLGMHAASGLNAMTLAIWGYAPVWTVPWIWVGLGIAFTMLVCLIAGVIPARHAARNNIIDALQTT